MSILLVIRACSRMERQAKRGNDVCRQVSVWAQVVSSENAFSLQKKDILQDFPTLCKKSVGSAQLFSSQLSKHKNTGQFIEGQVSLDW